MIPDKNRLEALDEELSVVIKQAYGTKNKTDQAEKQSKTKIDTFGSVLLPIHDTVLSSQTGTNEQKWRRMA